MPEQSWGTLNQDTMGGKTWEDFLFEMTMHAAQSRSVADDFNVTYDGFGTMTAARNYNNFGPVLGFGPNGVYRGTQMAGAGNSFGGGSGGGGEGGGTGKTAATGNAKTVGAQTVGEQAATPWWKTAAGKKALGTAGGMAFEGWQAREGADDELAALRAAGPDAAWTTPWGAMGDQLNALPQMLKDWYANASTAKPPKQGKGAGTKAMEQLLGEARGAGSPFVDMAENMIGGRMEQYGTFNPAALQVYNEAGQFQNPLIERVMGQAEGLDNPFLSMFTDAMGPQGGAGGGGGGARGGYYGGGGGGSSSGGGGGPTGWDPSLLNPYLQSVLDGKFLEGNPYLQDWIDDQATSIRGQFENSIIPGIGDNLERAGMLGSSMYTEALGDAQGAFVDQLGDMETDARYAAYNTGVDSFMDALNQLTGLQGQRMQGQFQQQAQDSANATSAGNARTAAESQKLGYMLDAAGLWNQQSLGGLGVMGDMAGLYSSSGLGALGLRGDMAMGMGDQDLGWLSQVGDLEEASWAGWDRSFGAAQALSNKEGQGANSWAREQSRKQGLLFDYMDQVNSMADRWGTSYGQKDNSAAIAAAEGSKPSWGEILAGMGIAAGGAYLGS